MPGFNRTSTRILEPVCIPAGKRRGSAGTQTNGSTVAQDDHRIRGWVPIFVHGSRFVFGKGAAKNRPDIPEREKVGRNHFSRDIIAEVLSLSVQTDAVQPHEIRK